MQATTTQQELIAQRERTEGYLRVDPNNKQLRKRAIELHLALSDPAGAQEHVSVALATFPNDPMMQCMQAHVFAAQKKWDAAAPIYAALYSKLADIRLAVSLATCQVWLGDHLAALATMAPFDHAPDLPAESVTLLVRALHHTLAYDEAKAVIARHEARLMTDASFLSAASLVYMDSGDTERAGQLSKAALDMGARPIEALVVSASLALIAADADRARDHFHEATEIAPHEGRGWAGLGMANMLARDYAAASIQLEQATTLMPTDVANWHSLAWCRLMSQDLDGAEKAFNEALALNRNFAETHGSLAVVAVLKGDRSKAEHSIELARRLDHDGFSAVLAQMMLDGVLADHERGGEALMGLIGGRPGPFGIDLAELAKSRIAK